MRKIHENPNHAQVRSERVRHVSEDRREFDVT